MANAQLPDVLATLAPVLRQHGHLAVAVFIMLEDFNVPSSGEAVLVAAAVYGTAGRLNAAAVAMSAMAAAVI